MKNKYKNIGLVLSGGGARGAYSLGVIDYILNEHFRCNPFKFISGTSVGSLLGVKVSDGDFETLKTIWFSIHSPKDIMSRRFFGVFGFLMGADSYSSLDPLFNKIKQTVNLEAIRSSGRVYQFSVINTRTRKLRYISSDDKNLTEEFLQKYILASCSIPGIFPPVKVDGNYYLDGGIRDVTPIKPAIEFGCDLIIVVRNSPSELPELPRSPNSIDLFSSVIDTMVNEIYISDIEKALFINDFIKYYRGLVNELQDKSFYHTLKIKNLIECLEDKLGRFKFLKIIVIEPKNDVIGTLDFYASDIKHAYELGFLNAKTIISNNEYLK